MVTNTYLLGIGLSSVFGYCAYRKHLLSRTGLLAFIMIGSVLFFGGSFAWLLTMFIFVLSASLLTKYRQQEKLFLDDIVEKTGPRDFVQGIANLGVGTVCAVLYIITSSPVFVFAFLGSVAASNADTWATEIGTLSAERPRLITTWKKVKKGTSGAISKQGTLGGIGGSLVIAICGSLLIYLDHQYFFWGKLLTASFLGGVVGFFVDSLLGATIQARYFSPKHNKVTEQVLFRHVWKTEHIGGVTWINNDVVNFLCSLTGAVVSVLVFMILVLT